MAGAVAVSLASLLATGGASAQTSAPAASPTPAARAAQAGQAAAQPKRSANTNRYRPDRFAGRAGTYYKMVWGVDSLAVKRGDHVSVVIGAFHADGLVVD